MLLVISRSRPRTSASIMALVSVVLGHSPFITPRGSTTAGNRTGMTPDCRSAVKVKQITVGVGVSPELYNNTYFTFHFLCIQVVKGVEMLICFKQLKKCM